MFSPPKNILLSSTSGIMGQMEVSFPFLSNSSITLSWESLPSKSQTLLAAFSISGSLSIKLLMEFRPLELKCLDHGPLPTHVGSAGANHMFSI